MQKCDVQYIPNKKNLKLPQESVTDLRGVWQECTELKLEAGYKDEIQLWTIVVAGVWLGISGVPCARPGQWSRYFPGWYRKFPSSLCGADTVDWEEAMDQLETRWLIQLSGPTTAKYLMWWRRAPGGNSGLFCWFSWQLLLCLDQWTGSLYVLGGEPGGSSCRINQIIHRWDICK